MAIQQTTIKPFTLEDFLIMSSRLNMNSDFGSTISNASDPSTRMSHSYQQYPVIPTGNPGQATSRWYGGSQPSLGSQTYLGGYQPIGTNLSSTPAIHRSMEHESFTKSSATPTGTNAYSFSNPRQTNPRATRLRRSNTVGSSDIGQHLPAALVRTSLAQFHSAGGSHSGPNYDLLQQLLSQTSAGPFEPSVHSGPQFMGHSPTERVLRRLAQINATSSLDRNGPVGFTPGNLQQSSMLDSSRTGKLNPLQAAGQLVVGSEMNSMAKGSIISGSFTSPISRRSRLRRELTLDGGGGSMQSRDSVETHSGAPHTDASFARPNLLPLGPGQSSPKPSNSNSIDGCNQVPMELHFSTERFQGRVLVQWLCRQLVKAGDIWSCNLITLVTNICSCLLRLGVLQKDLFRPNQNRSQNFNSVTISRPPLLHSASLEHSSSGKTLRNASAVGGSGVGGVDGDGGSDGGGTSSFLHGAQPLPFKQEEKFELNGYYRWTGQHTGRLLEELQASMSLKNADAVNSAIRSSHEMIPFHSRVQTEFAGLRKDYEYELERLTREHELQLFRVKNQGVMKVCQLTDRIEALEQEVEKYRILAGIEHLTRSSLTDDSSHLHRSDIGLYNASGNSTASSDRRYVKRFPTSPPATSRPRAVRVGFSLPEAVLDTHTNSNGNGNPNKPPQRPRARSEVTGMGAPESAALQPINSPLPPTATSPTADAVHQSEFITDELPKTKGFLRRLKLFGPGSVGSAASGTDSGLGNSKSGRSDSRDTCPKSDYSLDSDDIQFHERSNLHSTSKSDRAPPIPHRNMDFAHKSVDRSGRVPPQEGRYRSPATERVNQFGSDFQKRSTYSQPSDVLDRALNAMERSGRSNGLTMNNDADDRRRHFQTDSINLNQAPNSPDSYC